MTETPLEKITPKSLVSMDEFCADTPVRVDLAYAQDDNLLFGERIYKKDAKLWLHRSLAEIVRRAAHACHKENGLVFVLHDGLRTIEAQARMLETTRVQANLHWLQPPALLSSPGRGGHPRGMAIDISLETKDGNTVEMGTPFDFLAEDPLPEYNKAHREHPHLPEEVRRNRIILTDSLMQAAKDLNTPLLPLPQEWWDFRLLPEFYERYAPLSDADLPPVMRMMD